MPLPKMRLRRLKRFLPKRKPYRKPPSEKALVALAPKIERRFLGILKPLSSEGNYAFIDEQGSRVGLGNIGRIRNSDLLAESTTQAVIDLGYFRVGAGRIRLVGKLERMPKVFEPSIPKEFKGKGNTLIQADDRFALKTEGVANLLRRRDFPVPFKKAVRIGKKTAIVVSEHLGRKGATLDEAHGFDFKKLKNGEELQRQLQEYVRRIEKMDERGEIKIDTHLLMDGVLSAKIIENCFFVRHKNGIGELIMEDLSNVALKGSMWENREDQLVVKDRDKAIEQSDRLKGFFP